MVRDNINFKKRLFFHLGISVLIVIVLAIILILLGWDISKHTSNILKMRQDVTSYNQKLESLSSLKAGYEKAKQYMNVLENILPAEEGLLSVDRELSKLALENSLDLGFGFGEEIKSTETQLGSITFSMTTRSSLENFINFLAMVEEMRYFIQFGRLEITRQGDTFTGLGQGKIFARL